MNDNLIERTEKLLNGITPGEWRASMHNGITYDDGSSSFQCGIYPAQVKGLAPVLLTNNIDRRNAAFIAAAPELVRELLAEVKRLRDVMDELTDVLYVPTDEIVDAVRRRLTNLYVTYLATRNEKWSDECVPGGMVCAECGVPVKSEPCELHGGGLDVAEKVRGQMHEALNRVTDITIERDAALATLDAVRAWAQNGEAYIRGGQRKELFRILDGDGDA